MLMKNVLFSNKPTCTANKGGDEWLSAAEGVTGQESTFKLGLHSQKLLAPLQAKWVPNLIRQDNEEMR